MLIDAALLDTDRELLLRLLRTPTAGPLEKVDGEPPAELCRAQRDYAAAAAELGLRRVHYGCATTAEATMEDVPLAVRTSASTAFLRAQPSQVLRLGPALPAASTVMFNVHLDTVSGSQPVAFDGSRFTGRGAIDAKGPAVALLAGIRAAVAADASIGTEVGVLVQAVSGEEGGALGTIGTRPLVQAGFVGRLNIFCEPTGLHYLPRATAAMTACIRVDGRDATDDRPDAGHNATVLLGFLAQHLASTLDGHDRQGRVCVAGLHTGTLHNRVYGTGRLLLNLSYASSTAARELEHAVRGALEGGLAAFTERFSGSRELARTAADAAAVTTLEWHKRRLPSLANTDPHHEALLERCAGVPRWPDTEPAFTCDAIWMDGVPDAFTVVLGPGSLAANNAHADGEYAELAELEAFASAVARILVGFASDLKRKEPT